MTRLWDTFFKRCLQFLSSIVGILVGTVVKQDLDKN